MEIIVVSFFLFGLFLAGYYTGLRGARDTAESLGAGYWHTEPNGTTAWRWGNPVDWAAIERSRWQKALNTAYDEMRAAAPEQLPFIEMCLEKVREKYKGDRATSPPR